MPADVLIRIITAERVVVAVVWVIIGSIGWAAARRIVSGSSQKGDMLWASLLLIALGLLVFQWGALTDTIRVEADPFVAAGLFGFMLGGGGLLFSRTRGAPDEHKGAVIACFAAFLIVLVLAGLLS